jgi:hypothetical protein
MGRGEGRRGDSPATDGARLRPPHRDSLGSSLPSGRARVGGGSQAPAIGGRSRAPAAGGRARARVSELRPAPPWLAAVRAPTVRAHGDSGAHEEDLGRDGGHLVDATCGRTGLSHVYREEREKNEVFSS